MISTILKLFLLPVTIFRAILTFFSMIWMLMLITIIVLIAVYWDDVRKIFTNIIDSIGNIKNLVETLKDKIDVIEEKIEDIKDVAST